MHAPRRLRDLTDRLSQPVPRDHRESEPAFDRRRRVVAATSAVGAGLLGLSLSRKPDSPEFYGLTAATAATWVAGGLLAGPLHRGRMWAPATQVTQRPVLIPLASGVGAFALFYGIARVSPRIPVLHKAIDTVLAFADEGTGPAVWAITLANGVAEEVFFRGALYAAVRDGDQVLVSTAAYTAATVATRNPALVAAAAVMGTIFAVQRRVTGGIQAPMLTHVVWSGLMLKYLPPLFRRIRAAGEAPAGPRPRPNRS